MSDTAIDERPRAPVEHRSVSDFEVRWADRVIELVAMPYDHWAPALVRGRVVEESCAPGAYEGVERRVNRVKANRDHDPQRTVGRAVGLHPSRTEGLVTELRIAKTLLGDETLALADDHSLEPSVSFAVMDGGEAWSPDRRRRRLTRLFLDHVAMVPEGAYGEAGARVLDVRHAALQVVSPDPVATPNLDAVLAWLTADR